MDECYCGVPLSASQRERCPSPGCPAYGKRAGTPEWEAAIRAALARPYSQRGGPAALLDTLAAQVHDPVNARSRARVAARLRSYERNADDVRNGDQALAWLAAHATVQEGP